MNYELALLLRGSKGEQWITVLEGVRRVKIPRPGPVTLDANVAPTVEPIQFDEYKRVPEWEGKTIKEAVFAAADWPDEKIKQEIERLGLQSHMPNKNARLA